MNRLIKKNKMQNANKHGGTNEWITPKYILDALGTFELDPCAAVKQPWMTARTMLNKKDDGLKEDWAGRRVFLNPPYGSDIKPWLKKMAENKNGIALVAARTDTVWFQKYIFECSFSILFLAGRVRFYTVRGKPGKTAAGFPSCLVAYSANDFEVLRKSGLKGVRLEAYYKQ